VKRLGSRGAKGPGKVSGLDADREDEMMEDALVEVTADELREFLEADTLGVRADPAFKERLRRELWEIVRSRGRTRPSGNDDNH
jgi:hypothetical protein